MHYRLGLTAEKVIELVTEGRVSEKDAIDFLIKKLDELKSKEKVCN